MARKIVVVVEGAAGESVKADAADGSDGTAASGNRVEMALMTSPSLQDRVRQLTISEDAGQQLDGFRWRAEGKLTVAGSSVAAIPSDTQTSAGSARGRRSSRTSIEDDDDGRRLTSALDLGGLPLMTAQAHSSNSTTSTSFHCCAVGAGGVSRRIRFKCK